MRSRDKGCQFNGPEKTKLDKESKIQGDSAWESWRLHTLDVRMEHDRETNREAIPR